MPAYRLIISDREYVRLLKIGAEQGKTLGKLLNEIIRAYCDAYEAQKGK